MKNVTSRSFHSLTVRAFYTALAFLLLGLSPTLGPAWAAGSTSASGPAEDNSAAEEIRLFTHGDTPLLLPDVNGELHGPALDLFRCAMEGMERPFSATRAPLSRAGHIISDLNNAIWFPSAYRGDEERMARSIGPAGSLDVYWYKNKTNALDPNGSAFKQSATVTTYKGSAMARQLRDEGYNFIEGSADRNRLVSMLLSGQVDAFAAVDFRDRLSPEIHQKLSDNAVISIKNRIPSAFRISDKLFESEPSFTPNFRAAFDACLGNSVTDPHSK